MSSSRNTPPSTNRFVPNVESLEDRTVPSGNVQALVFDGTLYVTGDAAANQIGIAGTGAGSVVLRSLDGTTTINGRAALAVGGITRDLYVRLGGGDDQLLVSRLRTRGTLNVDTGDGNDTLGISDSGNRGATILSLGNGDDTAIFNGSVFRRYVSLDSGAGSDQVVANSIGAVHFGLFNPSGSDFFDNRGSTITAPAIVGFTNGTRPAPVVPPASPPVPPDTTPPTPTVSTTVTDPTNASPIAFTVSFDENVTGFDSSDLAVTNGIVTALTPIDARTFSAQVTPVSQGPVSLSVVAGGVTDAAGNGNRASNTVTRTFDSIAPTVTTNALTTNIPAPNITGTVNDPGAVVRVTVNGRTYTATVNGTTWTAAVTDLIPEGTYTISTTATDPAGNVGTAAPATLVVDITAPTVSTFDLATASDSGTVGDFRTDKTTVTLVGTTEARATVRLFAVTVPGTPGTGTQLAETIAAADGTFSFAGIALPAGPKSFAVRALDAAGNTSATFAQTFTRNTAPTVARAVAAQTVAASGANLTFDLTSASTGVFADAERIVRLTTSAPTGPNGALQTASIDVNLFAAQAPGTVANFLSYDYSNTVFHRLAPGFVLQGGGFNFNDAGTTTATAFPPLTKSPPIANEPGISNTRGTIAMAKTGGDPNSATNEFFFNLADNSNNLDSQNGGFTVFGQVLGTGQQALNALSGLGTFSGSGIPGAAPFPIRSGANTTNFPANINASDVALVTTATELGAVGRMTFAATSSSPGVATASVSGGTLTVDPSAAGTTTITMTATDLDGSVTQTQFVVTVTP